MEGSFINFRVNNNMCVEFYIVIFFIFIVGIMCLFKMNGVVRLIWMRLFYFFSGILLIGVICCIFVKNL